VTDRLNVSGKRSQAAPRIAALALAAGFALVVPVSAGPREDRVSSLPSPEEYFGHPMAADRTLVHYDEFVPYLDLLARGSDRVAIERLGTSTRGRDLVMLVISTPENLARVARYREIAGKLHDPRGLAPAAVDSLVREGKVILLVTMNIHSSEIVSSQTGLELAFRLATGGEDSPARYLKDVIVLIVPSMNPDGQAMITEWYRKYAGTRYEGGAMPWLYHPYAGHDNNRDWYMLNLPETRAVNRVAYRDWLPQVLVDVHQMGATGPRAFVPPYTDPVSERIHPLIHRECMLVGANMALDMEQEGKSGVIYGYSFDAYWPGGTRSTPSWKNTVGILIEIASARVMTPIYVDPGELAGGQKGLPDYQPQINFPNPWPGGWWHPRDILEYQRILVESAIETCALHREDFLRNQAHMAMDAVEIGGTTQPFGYVIPPGQHDPGTAAKLVDLLMENGIEVHRAPEDLIAGVHVVPKGSFVILSAQPYRSFLVEMMNRQEYPEVRVGPGTEEIYRPYDVTAWTLPYMMGVESWTLDTPAMIRPGALERVTGPAWTVPPLAPGAGSRWALRPADNDAYAAVLRLLEAGATVRQARSGFTAADTAWPAGTFLIEASGADVQKALRGLYAQATPVEVEGGDLASPDRGGPALRTLHTPRTAVYQSWLAAMDEGWTRYVLDAFGFPVTVLHNQDIRNGGLARNYDVIILPDQDRIQIVDGKRADGAGRYEEPRPEPYEGGLGTQGVKALDTFVQQGGTLVTLGSAAELAIHDLNLPVKNVTEGMAKRDVSTPGAILRVDVDTRHPLGYGMPERALIYHTTDPVLGTQVPGPESERRVVARFIGGDGVLASGWAAGTKVLERKAALVEAAAGKGAVVLFAFRPQHRGQTHGTYRMLFNALLDAAAEDSQP
jgi:hypothetical protein